MQSWMVGLLAGATAFSNVISVDTQNFNPSYSGLDFVTVHSSETLEPGIFNLGLFVNYAVNTLPYYSEPGSVSGKKTRLGRTRDSILSTDLSFGLGLTSWWDIGVSIPFMTDQKIHTEGPRGEFGDPGMTEVRIATKLRLLGHRRAGLALQFSTNFNMVQHNPFVGDGAGPIYNGELIGDFTLFRRVAFGVNVGYRKRDPGSAYEEFPIEPTEDQWIASAASSLHFPRIDSKVIAEVFMSKPVTSKTSKIERQQSSAEALLGVKSDVTTQMALHVGGGTELNHSIASPDWRIYLGTNITLGPLWGRSHDAVVERKVKKKLVKYLAPRLDDVPSEEGGTALVPLAVGEEYASDADETFVLRDIHFAFDSDYRALPGAKKMLEALADRVRTRNFKKLVIEGHTDSMGSFEYNVELGQRRAQTIRQYLIQQFALNPQNIFTQTYGENRPIGDNANYQGRQLNRRVVFRVYY